MSYFEYTFSKTYAALFSAFFIYKHGNFRANRRYYKLPNDLKKGVVLKKICSSLIALILLSVNFQSVAKAQSNHLTPVHFTLNWLSNVEFNGLWVAQQKGWFKQAGIDFSYTEWAPGIQPETNVPSTSGNQFGFQSGAAIAIAQSRNVPIQALYTDTQKSVFGLMVLAKSHVHKITDLRGKKIGYQSHEFYVPATMLSYAGLKETDWKPVQVGFDTAQLTAGQVDAFLCYVSNEPIALKLQGVKTRVFPASSYGFNFYDDVMFAPTALIKKNPSLVKKVTEIVARGFAYGHEYPNYATGVTVSKYFPASQGVSAKQNYTQQLLELKALNKVARDRHGKFSGLMTSSVWQSSINTLYKYKEITTKPNISSLFTNRFNPYR